MRFFYAKKEQKCKHCKTLIRYGDEAVVIRWKNINVFIPLVFHVGCYIDWVTTSFNRRWEEWKTGAVPRRTRKKRGRKYIYSSREQAKRMNRLKSLLSYHRKAGNTSRVSEVEARIIEIRKRGFA